MPERKPNQFARFVAVIGLIAAFAAVAATIATTSSDSGDDDGRDEKAARATKQGRRALERGFWRVGEGDTLAQIAQETGIEVSQLEELNPRIDPQRLSPGDKVRLLEADEASGSGGSGSTGSDAEEVSPQGSGVGDEGPTGQATETESSLSD